MNEAAFDTYEATNTLVNAGYEEKQAAATISMVRDVINNNVASKSDIRELKSDIRELELRMRGYTYEQIGNLRNDSQKQIADLKNDTQKQIADLKNDTQKQIGSLRNEMQEQTGSLRNEMQEQIGSLRNEMQEQIGSLRNETYKYFTKLESGMRELAIQMKADTDAQISQLTTENQKNINRQNIRFYAIALSIVIANPMIIIALSKLIPLF